MNKQQQADEVEKRWQEWVASRPECVQRLIAEFPRGSEFCMPDGKIYYLIGYNESDALLVSETSPFIDYKTAVATKFPICASHVRPCLKTLISPN